MGGISFAFLQSKEFNTNVLELAVFLRVPESLAAEILHHPIELFRVLNGDNGVT